MTDKIAFEVMRAIALMLVLALFVAWSWAIVRGSQLTDCAEKGHTHYGGRVMFCEVVDPNELRGAP